MIDLHEERLLPSGQLKSFDAQIERAEGILESAIQAFQPVEIFAGFSGGYDSIVSTHLTMTKVKHASVLHLNTGIGIERTREFVRQTSRDFGWEYHEAKTAESFEDMILGKCLSRDTGEQVYPGGFPGPAMHGTMYQRLKERPLLKFASVARAAYPKENRGRRWVMMVTGIRGDESRVRTGYKRAFSIDKQNSMVWLNPLYWASADSFREYRKVHDLPLNPVKEALGFSGECLCEAHADTGELLRIRMACPATADYIESLQVKVAAAGFPWGYEDKGPPKEWLREKRDAKRGQRTLWDAFSEPPACKPGPLCHSCEKYSAGMPQEIGVRRAKPAKPIVVAPPSDTPRTLVPLPGQRSLFDAFTEAS